MDSNEFEIDFSYSDFDDRLDGEEVYETDDSDDEEPLEEEESFYRHLEEY